MWNLWKEGRFQIHVGFFSGLKCETKPRAVRNMHRKSIFEANLEDLLISGWHFSWLALLGSNFKPIHRFWHFYPTLDGRKRLAMTCERSKDLQRSLVSSYLQERLHWNSWNGPRIGVEWSLFQSALRLILCFVETLLLGDSFPGPAEGENNECTKLVGCLKHVLASIFWDAVKVPAKGLWVCSLQILDHHPRILGQVG